MRTATHLAPDLARYDVVVAGARVAGAATALGLARRGLRVLVVDPVPSGRDTLSTHALMRGGVLQLHRWGLLEAVRAEGTPPVRRTVFDYGRAEVVVDIAERDGVDALYAPRRTVLDPLLQRAAAAAGAELAFGWAVVDVMRRRDGRVVGARLSGPGGASREVSADWVVGADGVRSRVARAVGTETLVAARHATATVYGHAPAPAGLDAYRFGFRPALGFGVIPTNSGMACLFAAVRPERFEAERGEGLPALLRRLLVEADPEHAGRLASGSGLTGVRGFAGRRGFIRRAVGPGWALVGDAGYFRDPLTAHGITDALRDAELLVRVLVGGRPEGYVEARAEAAGEVFAVTDEIASLDWTLDELEDLHRRLSRAMNVGVRILRDLDGSEAGVSTTVTAAGSAAESTAYPEAGPSAVDGESPPHPMVRLVSSGFVR